MFDVAAVRISELAMIRLCRKPGLIGDTNAGGRSYIHLGAQIPSRHKHRHFYCDLNILHKSQCSHATTKYTVKWTARKQKLTEMKTAVFTKFVQINDAVSALPLWLGIRRNTLCDTKKKAAHRQTNDPCVEGMPIAE
jgi:hypothetical protein